MAIAEPPQPAEVGPSRTVERLVALLRYEMEPDHGCSAAETLEGLLKFTIEVLLNGCPEKPTAAYLDRMRAESVAMAEYIVRGLVATGHIDDAERFVEEVAASRRECEAKFKLERVIPFDPKEREALGKRWDEKCAAYAARTETN